MNLYPFIEAEKTQQRNVKRACELLKVSRAAYYAHRVGSAVDPPAGRRGARTSGSPKLPQGSKGCYGAPRIGAVAGYGEAGHAGAATSARIRWPTPARGTRQATRRSSLCRLLSGQLDSVRGERSGRTHAAGDDHPGTAIPLEAAHRS